MFHTFGPGHRPAKARALCMSLIGDGRTPCVTLGFFFFDW
jgi:hypothetical protein